VRIDWKPLVVGLISAFARERDARVITDVVIPAVENIVSLVARPDDAPALTEQDVRAALSQARLPWQQAAATARRELDAHAISTAL
jgi:hypothetical protein